MFIKSKKGDVRTEPISILGLEIGPGIFLLLLFIAICIALYAVFFAFTGVSCDNKAEWKQVSSALTKIDKSSQGSMEIQFYNKNCKLIGFSDQSENQESIITRGKGVGIGTQFCLCSIKDGFRCDALYCQRLENIKLIKDEYGRQVTTIQSNDYTLLKFTKEGDKLLVTSDFSPEIKLDYDRVNAYRELDKGLIESLDVTLKRKPGAVYTGILPIIKFEQLRPEVVPEKSILFSFDLRDVTGLQDATIGDFEVSSQRINPEDVLSLDISFYVSNELKSEKNINQITHFYYKDKNEWFYVPIECKEEITGSSNSKDEDNVGEEGTPTGDLLCSISLNLMPENMALGEYHG